MCVLDCIFTACGLLIGHTVVKVTGIDVVNKRVAVEAGKMTVVVLAGRVETDKIVLVCALFVMVTVNDDAGTVLVIVDGGTCERDVLTDTTVLTIVVVPCT